MIGCSHNNHTSVVPRDLSFQAGYYDSLQDLQLSKTIGNFSSLAAYMTLPSIVKITQQRVKQRVWCLQQQGLTVKFWQAIRTIAIACTVLESLEPFTPTNNLETSSTSLWPIFNITDYFLAILMFILLLLVQFECIFSYSIDSLFCFLL